MSQKWHELEQKIDYHFHNQDLLRRALTCESAINEHHPDAATENYQALEFIGDAALKYAVASLLYTTQNHGWSGGNMHDQVVPYISNSNLSRIGRELDLSRFIIKGKGVLDITDNMLADAVEAILGAIVIDQQQQEHSADSVLFDVVARLWTINRKGKLMLRSPVQHHGNEDKRCCCSGSSCCKCFAFFCLILMVVGVIAFLLYSRAGADL